MKVDPANLVARFSIFERPPYWLVVPLALAGCSGMPGQRAGNSGKPLALVWEQSYQLKATGTSASATFFATRDTDKPPLKLMASFNGFAEGTKIKLGSEEGILNGHYWSTLIDIKSAVLKQSLEDLKGPIDLDLELRLEPPGAPAAATKLPKQDVKESLRLALMKARDGGLSFGDGDTALAQPRGAAVISGYSDLDFIGGAKSLKELDWVVIAEDQKEPRATKSCSFKEGMSTLKIFDANAVVFDRRTGAKRAEQVVKASDECPMFALVSKTDNTVKKSVSKDDVAAWARAQLATAKP